MTSIDRELESHLILQQIREKRDQFRQILQKYEVNTPQELEDKIAQGDLPEHPSYEDYLMLLSLENSLQEMKNLAKSLIEVI